MVIRKVPGFFQFVGCAGLNVAFWGLNIFCGCMVGYENNSMVLRYELSIHNIDHTVLASIHYSDLCIRKPSISIHFNYCRVYTRI